MENTNTPEHTTGSGSCASPCSQLLTSDQVKAVFSPHMQSVWDAAAECLSDPSKSNLEAFKTLCRPAEIMVLMREYAESISSAND